MPNRFTPRELLIMSQVEQGSNSRQIAAALGITEASAYVHRRRLRQKLAVEDGLDGIASGPTQHRSFSLERAQQL
jgi:DNA-binding NarL/FixJ family response regulator